MKRFILRLPRLLGKNRLTPPGLGMAPEKVVLHLHFPAITELLISGSAPPANTSNIFFFSDIFLLLHLFSLFLFAFFHFYPFYFSYIFFPVSSSFLVFFYL